jgi:hypothetical protein
VVSPFCTGRFQAQAFAELTQLPLSHPYRAPLMESLANYRVILESRPSRTSVEQELFMQLSPLYLENIAAAEQRGVQLGEQVGERRGSTNMVVLLLTQKFGSLSPSLLAQVESLSLEQLQALTVSVLSLSSTAELSNWLNSLKVGDS